ncbi:hypothetical protein I3843_12G009700 [Carya illinoinensis]|nr:hypothetical protein I3843_12G009700 [Carya illinoinensis]
MENNRLQLKTSIESVRWLTFQACAFRGHDESSDSKNQGNFIELIKLLASYNDQVNGVVMENAPQNAKYTSPKIQKEILHIFANKVRNVICEEIGDTKFCILVDEARDESKREQMAIILRFVDKDDTMAPTLKNEICALLSRYDLQIENIRGQGYDGGSNMRGEWNGLQALFLKDCPYVYYVHCWAHKLQLALVAASREAKYFYQFFVHLTSIINIVVGSFKRHDELQSTQMGIHFQSVCSLMRMFSATCSIINTISNEGSNYSQCGDAKAAYMVLTSFEFILILHMMKKIMGISNALCQSLQQNFQDIVNAMSLFSTTKVLIQNLRDDGWESLLTDAKSFCEKHQIDIPDMNDQFNDHTMELLILSVALNPKGVYKSFKIDDICELFEKFYPQDFTKQEKFLLRIQLQHYELDVPAHLDFQDMSTLFELCKGLVILKNSKIYYLIDRLIRLVLTLLVSTATTERAFFAMKIIKTRLRTRMEDEFLADHLLVYVEKEIAKNLTSEMIMDEFYFMKDRR